MKEVDINGFRRQPEGASRQAVGALIGALVGLTVAARRAFSDYSSAGQVPWVNGLAITMIGGVAGLLLVTLFGRPEPDGPKTTAVPDLTRSAPALWDETHASKPDHRVKLPDGVNQMRTPDDRVQGP